MTPVELDALWDRVKSLTSAERRQLRERIDASLGEHPLPIHPAPPPQAALTPLDRVLLERGVISAVPQQPADVADFESWRPVEVQGPPVSQTIIEERR